MHIFADASSEAYAAAAFLVCTYVNLPPSSHLIIAKAHVTPKQISSIPRLELLAAELAVNLRRQAASHVKVKIQRFVHWTDSLTVLFWINNDHKRYQTFVHNKISYIQSHSNVTEWRWLPSHLNPADLPSRGVPIKKLLESTLWSSGPEFLLTGAWPQPPVVVSTPAVLRELRKHDQVFISSPSLESVLDFNRFSSWARLVRTFLPLAAWRLRVGERLGTVTAEPPTPWKLAETWTLRQAQINISKHWLSDTSTANQRKMGWTMIRPFVAEDGLLRAGGRLQQAKHIPAAMRTPVILDRKHPATEMIIRQLHEASMHYGGTNFVLSKLMARVWVPGGRAVVRRTLEKCIHCRRQRARANRRPVGLLPRHRLPGGGGPGTSCRVWAD